MKMYNPPHPAEIIKGLWLEPMNISMTEAAEALGVTEKMLSNIVDGHDGVTPEMAVRLSIALGCSAESWMGHQVAYDLWQVEQYKGELNAHLLEVA